MSAEIVDLFPRDDNGAMVTPKGYPGVVDTLENYLQDAREGKIIAIGISAVTNEMIPRQVWGIGPDSPAVAMALLGSAHAVATILTQRMLDAMTPVEREPDDTA